MQKKSIEKIKDEKGSVFGYVLKPNGKITEFSVEDKFTLGDVVVEKNKDKNIAKKMTTKILQILGVKQNDTKLLAAGNNWKMGVFK